MLYSVTLNDCRLSLEIEQVAPFGEPRFPKAAAGDASMSTAGRSLLQSGGVNTGDFSCVGCAANGADTRSAVADTSSFPYSAIGQLMGQVTSNTCANSPLPFRA